MSPVAMSLEIFSCYKCTYSHVCLKDCRKLIVMFDIVQEKTGIKETANQDCSQRNFSFLGTNVFYVCLKGNLPMY